MTNHIEISNRIEALLKEAGIESLVSGLSYGDTAKAIKDAVSDLSGFAEACYNDNSVSELVKALTEDADTTDMKSWNIDEEEWHEAIKTALLANAESIIDDLEEAESEWFES